MPAQNIWTAASDGDVAVVARFLAQDPSAVNSHDENGYTPIHAAASYNHISLLTSLIRDHGGDVNITDNEGDTPLFAAETVDVAMVLVEQLNADVNHRNNAGLTAAEAMEQEGSSPLVAAYLQQATGSSPSVPRPPPGVSVNINTMDDVSEMMPPVDEALRQEIGELATREDFTGATTQADLRDIIMRALHRHVPNPELEAERNVRQKQNGICE